MANFVKCASWGKEYKKDGKNNSTKWKNSRDRVLKNLSGCFSQTDYL